jgi:hypothetical protein
MMTRPSARHHSSAGVTCSSAIWLTRWRLRWQHMTTHKQRLDTTLQLSQHPRRCFETAEHLKPAQAPRMHTHPMWARHRTNGCVARRPHRITESAAAVWRVAADKLAQAHVAQRCPRHAAAAASCHATFCAQHPSSLRGTACGPTADQNAFATLWLRARLSHVFVKACGPTAGSASSATLRPTPALRHCTRCGRQARCPVRDARRAQRCPRRQQHVARGLSAQALPKVPVVTVRRRPRCTVAQASAARWRSVSSARAQWARCVGSRA